MKELKTAFLNDYREVITYILTATEHDPSDEYTRNRVANTLMRAIRQSSAKGGSIADPRHTNLYKFALLLKDCKTQEEFKTRYKAMIKKWSLHNFLKVNDLEWKPVHFATLPVCDTSRARTAKATTFTVKVKDTKPEVNVCGNPFRAPNISEWEEVDKTVKPIIEQMLAPSLQWINNASEDFSTLKFRVEEIHTKFDDILTKMEEVNKKYTKITKLLNFHEHLNGAVVAPISDL